MSHLSQTVMITGAAGNLGRAVAAAFAAQGAKLVLLDLNEDALSTAYGVSNDNQALLPANLLDTTSLAKAVKDAEEWFGDIDVLCNVAGGFAMGEPVHQLSNQTWDLMMNLNATSLINTARLIVPKMISAGGGKIINIAATAGNAGGANKSAYCAAKGTVIRLTESMSAELREQNINVNCVLPSIIDTPANRADMPDADFSRWVTPAALADVIVFLASENARAIHGAAVPVAGLS
ncbi:SDR family NAD(P)-dependent oxidoreductase [Pseudomonas sp. BF-R-19]|uniref:SDR family NAD(P)-dependent oxidoreductase n=1 Tax=Pseudomonas sp. BF-R-19 TaxID=2832397 RepID=UPI001CBB3FE1|nr:SDR family NAD(P)-dependent oxidoreductase [Pseudomonas sp. BF-R-19]